MAVHLHPYMVHFATGLLLTAVLLFVVARLGMQRSWSDGVLQAARWNLWIGAGCALASIATGFFDYVDASCDVEAIAATVIHRRSGAVTWWSSLIAAVAVYRTRHRRPGPLLLGWLLWVGLAASTATYLGTQLTYARGLGVAAAWPADAPRCFELERS
ncbi:MAG: hypothetical protein FJ197_11785 [Gammaproteobacteria bacterium]|nr:hypothetical protein [Gammaproteobacteria bacterium]